MIQTRHHASALLALFIAIVAPEGCGPADAALDSKIWFCDPRSTSDQCGTSHGRPMTCYSAQSLGGHAFCAETCDPTVGSADPTHFACVGKGALLSTCTPHDTKQGCPAGLSCYRTSLDPREDTGLCLPVPVCSSDADCAGSAARSVCLGPLVDASFSNAKAVILTDNLQCVARCAAPGEMGPGCADDEACLPDFYPGASTPDICVPRCNGSDSCPPNFSCLADISPAYPHVCLPGFPGSRCTRDEECAIGGCRDTGAGFRVCTLDCDSDFDICPSLDGARGPSFCADSICVIKSPFTGVNCSKVGDCKNDEKCSSLDPYDPKLRREASGDECHRLCDAPGQCSQDRVPYVCLKDGDDYSECYPADFGLPCAPGLERCMGKLVCLGPNQTTDSAEATCTIACQHDSDCRAYNLTAAGRCRDGICQLQHSGDPCSSTVHCLSGRCGADGTCE